MRTTHGGSVRRGVVEGVGVRRTVTFAALLCLTGVTIVWFVSAWSTAVLDSASMEPWASRGDLLVHRIVPADAVAVGDVITVRTTDRGLVTHRVVAIDESDGDRVALLQGDASPFPDRAAVTLRSEVDRVAVVVPWLGDVLRVGGPWLLGGAVLLLCGALVLGLGRRHTPVPVEEVEVVPARAVDPRVEALLATCEQLQEDGIADAVLADIVRVRTAAIAGLPSAERSGAVLSTHDGARFYVLAVADVDRSMLGLVPVDSTRRRTASAALDDWWAAVQGDLPRDVVEAIAPWTGTA